MEDSKFIFGLLQNVKLIGSDEAGTVVGRAEYMNSRNYYYVRYRAADGRLIESWWAEDALEAA